MDILRGTEASSKNIFGRYSSQRMKVGDFKPVICYVSISIRSVSLSDGQSEMCFLFCCCRTGRRLFPFMRQIISTWVSIIFTRASSILWHQTPNIVTWFSLWVPWSLKCGPFMERPTRNAHHQLNNQYICHSMTPAVYTCSYLCISQGTKALSSKYTAVGKTNLGS